MDFPDPPSSFDLVADRRVTARSLAAAWCLALLALAGLATVPLLASDSRPALSHSVAGETADRQATLQHAC
jgi:hypothetical protein